MKPETVRGHTISDANVRSTKDLSDQPKKCIKTKC